VDDFTVNYVGKHHADHLRNALLQSYELTADWEGKVYSGMSLKWDYKHRTCDLSLSGYVSNVLSKFQHDAQNIHSTHRQNMSHVCMEQKLNMQRKMKLLPSRLNSV
jgi:hypothetical protein